MSAETLTAGMSAFPVLTAVSGSLGQHASANPGLSLFFKLVLALQLI